MGQGIRAPRDYFGRKAKVRDRVENFRGKEIRKREFPYLKVYDTGVKEGTVKSATVLKGGLREKEDSS